MADKYQNYEQLSSDMEEGVDYRIRLKKRESTVCVVAPHGGKIEYGTSELAEAIVGHKFNFYAFEGLLKTGSRDLHITSHKFDEPIGLKVSSLSRTVFGVHGRKDCNDFKTVYLGGLDKSLIRKLADNLADNLAAIGVPTKIGGHPFKAENKHNICNRGKSGMGGQLEISKSMREALLKSKTHLDEFSYAVQSSLEWLQEKY